MNPKKLTLFLFISVVLFLSGCTYTSYYQEKEWVAGDLLDLKVKNDELLFAFKSADGSTFNNYQVSMNYEVKIDESVETPSLRYEKVYFIEEKKNLKVETIERKKEPLYEEENLDSNDRIVITMNKETYQKLFGVPPVLLNNNDA